MTLRTLSGHKASQHAEEIVPFIDILKARGVRTYLEIGARHGDTFYDVMQALGPDSTFGLALDLPGGPWGTAPSKEALLDCVDRLDGDGFNVQCVFGNSQHRDILQLVRRHMNYVGFEKFDAILIDGDHTYEGVHTDWLQYSPLAGKLVAFHDIAGEGVRQRSTGHLVEVPRLWRELKQIYPHHEFIAPDKPNPMGIGVLDLEA